MTARGAAAATGAIDTIDWTRALQIGRLRRRAARGNHRDNAIIAKRAGAKTLVLTHLLAQIDQPGIREQIVHEIQPVFDGRVIWREDLMRLGLSGSRVSTIERA